MKKYDNKYILGLEGQSGITIELKVKIRAN